MSAEESFNVTLKLIHSDGIISGARILKARSKLPEDILDTINKLFTDTFEPAKALTKTTVALGNIGEQMVLAHLINISKYNTEFNVMDTSNLKDHGDLAVEYKSNRICIEVKNYTKPIPGKEIDKYHKSLSLPDYDMGLMISLGDNGFAREYKIKSPIDIKIIDGKPTAYLSGVDMDMIYPTISVLMTMISDVTSDTATIQQQLDIKAKALLAVYDQTKEMKVLIEAQKKSLSKLESMLNDIQALALS
jgi:hypothetical protein